MKPANVLLEGTAPPWKALVTDFGLAKNFEQAGLSGLTLGETQCGTPWYMPREQIVRYRFVKPTCDVYSAGAMLYYMLTGRFAKAGLEVLARAGRYGAIRDNLRVKEVVAKGRRYVVCHNPDQAKKDKADREAILASLEGALKKGAKSLVGNRGYRKYLDVERGAVRIDRAKAREEARYDGKFVLQTNLDLDAGDVAVKYKELWRVERAFRMVKSVLETRPIYHKCDETILGHVFASFLALVVMHEIDRRLAAKGLDLEWEDVKQDLEVLAEVEVFEGEGHHWLRTELCGVAGKVLSACGVRIPAMVRPAG